MNIMSPKQLRQHLNFAHCIGKRLDEHRELVESILNNTDLFERCPWHIEHMATQDDYLMRLFYLDHGFWADHDTMSEWPERRQPYHASRPRMWVRPRPAILCKDVKCRLPEYPGKGYVLPSDMSLTARIFSKTRQLITRSGA